MKSHFQEKLYTDKKSLSIIPASSHGEVRWLEKESWGSYFTPAREWFGMGIHKQRPQARGFCFFNDSL